MGTPLEEMAKLDPFKKTSSVEDEMKALDPFISKPSISTPSIIPQQASQVPVIPQQKTWLEENMPAVSGGIDEFQKSGQYPSMTTQIGPSFETVRANVQGTAEIVHAGLAPILSLLGSSIGGLSGMANAYTKGPEAAQDAVKKAAEQFEIIAGVNRDYRYSEPRQVRAAMQIAFGAFDDLGNATKLGLDKLGVPETVSVGASTLIKGVPFLLGYRSSSKIAKSVELKLQNDPVFRKQYTAEVLMRDKIETFAKENYDNFRSDLADAMKQAIVENDVAKQEKLKTIQDNISVVYDEALRKSEFEDVPVSVAKPTTTSVSTAKTTVEINGVDRPDIAAGFMTEKASVIGSERGVVGRDINLEKQATDYLVEAQKRWESADAELKAVEAEIETIRAAAKKSGKGSAKEALRLIEKKNIAKAKVEELDLFRKVTENEELTLNLDEVVAEAIKPDKESPAISSFTLSELKEKAKASKAELTAMVGHNGAMIYEIKKDGGSYIKNTLKEVDEFLGGEVRKIEKVVKTETPSEIIERYRQMDLSDPARKPTREQDLELLAAVKARKEELKSKIVESKPATKSAKEVVKKESAATSGGKQLFYHGAESGTKKFTKGWVTQDLDYAKRYAVNTAFPGTTTDSLSIYGFSRDQLRPLNAKERYKLRIPEGTVSDQLVIKEGEVPKSETVLSSFEGYKSPGLKAPEVGAKVSAKEPVKAVEMLLPKELSKANPRYAYGDKQFTLKFESDVDRAAYITAQKTLSKRDADFLQFVIDKTGMSEEQVRAHGESVRAVIKPMANKGKGGTELYVRSLWRGGKIPEPTAAPAKVSVTKAQTPPKVIVEVPKFTPLTAAQKATLPDMFAARESAKTIAAKTGMNIDAIRAARTELGIPTQGEQRGLLFTEWRRKYKKEKYQDKNEKMRQEAIARTEDTTPEILPSLDDPRIKAALEEAKRRKDHLVEADSISADSDLTMLRNEPDPVPRYEFLEEAVKFYEIQKRDEIISGGIVPPVVPGADVIGISGWFNVMRESFMKMETRSGIPLSKHFFEIQNAIKAKHALELPYAKREAAASKGMLLSEASRGYRLLEIPGLDERNITFKQAQDFISNNESLRAQFGNLTEKEFNFAKAESQILYDAGMEFGIPIEAMVKNKDYASRVLKEGERFDTVKDSWLKPGDVKWWAEEQRSGYLMPHEENLSRVVKMYVSRGAFKKALGEPLGALMKLVEADKPQNKGKGQLHQNEGQVIEKFMNDVRDIPTEADAFIKATTSSLVRGLNHVVGTMGAKAKHENIIYKRTFGEGDTKGHLEELRRDPGYFNTVNAAESLLRFHLTSTYAGALIRPIALLRNLNQTLLTTMPLTREYFPVGVARAMTSKGRKEAKAAGVYLDDFMPLGGELETGMGGTYMTAMEKGLSPYSMIDNFNRAVSYHAGKAMIEGEGKKFFDAVKNERELSKVIEIRDKFLDDSEMSFFHPIIIRDQFIPFMVKGDLEGLSKSFARQLADETQFVYRKANSGTMLRGMLGKVGGQFGTYPLWYTSYLKHLVSRGSAANITKRVIAITAINTTLQEVSEHVFGVNISKWLWFNPISWSGGVAATMSGGAWTYGMSKLSGQSNEYSESKALSAIESGAAIHIPGYLTMRDIYKGFQEQELGNQVKVTLGMKPAGRR